jgi:hypothetical protein
VLGTGDGLLGHCPVRELPMKLGIHMLAWPKAKEGAVILRMV